MFLYHLNPIIMHKGFFITGTDTGVGKTFVAAGLIRALKEQGLDVCPMKPAETGCRISNGRLIPDDTLKLIQASGVDEPIDLINPYRFRKPLAPSVAADIEGGNFKKRVVLDTYKQLAEKYEVIVVEGAGGIMVPLYKRYLFLDLVKDLNLPLMIVARSGLGTINHSLLTIEAARKKGIKILGVVMNSAIKSKKDISCKTNPEVIAQIGKVSILGIVPHVAHSDNKIENNIFNIIATKLIDQLN